ncbi:MAG TPA: Pr6Pr family membrane protein [Dyella sp.]|uniref:Pr6Pr family membrane protein n=1 Tax=Dyella sp. TaxID=1869338 RepID=UPI002CDB8958|nr:Pr6Pr family membrane protein [Dyella sp.]HTV84026.1 Pr6Pr family membrane protein [Dyella sp.]
MDVTDGKARNLAALTAAVGGFALVLRLYLTLHDGTSVAKGLIDYFGFLTEWTNGLVFLAMATPLLAPHSKAGRFFMRKDVIGWVTSSILFVGIAYFLLLSRNGPKEGLGWLANVLLHYAVPAMVAIYAAIGLRGTALPWAAPLWWALYLIVYFIYALIRGALIDRYPYGFINVDRLGYAMTVRNGFMLLLAFLLLSYALLLIWRFALARNRAA